MSLEQLDEHSEVGSDSVSSSTMSTAPTMTGFSSQLSVASTSTSSANRQVIPVDIAANKTENPVSTSD